MKKKTEMYRTDWNGVLLEIVYEPLWMPAYVAGEDLAHIEVRSIYPTSVPLPIAKTGFYTNTLPAAEALHPSLPQFITTEITRAPHRSQLLGQF